jgi:hypothetical protein
MIDEMPLMPGEAAAIGHEESMNSSNNAGFPDRAVSTARLSATGGFTNSLCGAPPVLTRRLRTEH